MMPDDPDPFTSPENRLEKRDKLFCEDDTVALAIKSGMKILMTTLLCEKPKKYSFILSAS